MTAELDCTSGDCVQKTENDDNLNDLFSLTHPKKYESDHNKLDKFILISYDLKPTVTQLQRTCCVFFDKQKAIDGIKIKYIYVKRTTKKSFSIYIGCEKNGNSDISSYINENELKEYFSTNCTECVENFKGKFCEKKISYCYDEPCTYGNCSEFPEEEPFYKCDCYKTSFVRENHLEYRNEKCSEVVKVCDKIQCQNGGTCFDTKYYVSSNYTPNTEDYFFCRCWEPFYLGRYCEIDNRMTLENVRQRKSFAAVAICFLIGIVIFIILLDLKTVPKKNKKKIRKKKKRVPLKYIP
ncbi:hypothetical protein SNEBB_007920 [Seison nebaliae]|nr:hypothetical protein SNEBB_007920 [Seison nebaliae]